MLCGLKQLTVGALTIAGGVLLAFSATLTAQSQVPPPVQGPQSLAVEGNVNKLYTAANTIIVATEDGVEHAFHYTKNLVVHGTLGSDPLQGLREGATVVVHYTLDGANASASEIDRVGDGGLKTAEGMVTRIDRRQKQITIKFANGRSETLALTDRAAADAGNDISSAASGSTKVVVYYSDEAGHKVAHFFKRIS